MYEVPESRKVTSAIYLAFSSPRRVIINSVLLRNSPLNPKLGIANPKLEPLKRRRMNICKLQQGIIKKLRGPLLLHLVHSA